MVKLTTKNAAETLARIVKKKNDNSQLLANLSGVDWTNIVSMDLFYHRSCYSKYTRDNSSDKGMEVCDLFYVKIDNLVMIIHAHFNPCKFMKK